MKKIIAAALSLLVGAFGFTIVDKTLEQRVADLEYSVSSLEERLNTEGQSHIVPNVSGLKESDAKEVLANSGYMITTTYEYSDTVKEGYVISNSLSNAIAYPGADVILIVSLGKREVSVSIHFTLPDTGTTATLSAKLDGVNIYSETEKLDGSDYSIIATGSEANSYFKVYVDGILIYRCIIDFTSDPCKVSNSTHFEYVVQTELSTEKAL